MEKMVQHGVIFTESGGITVELPAPHRKVLDHVLWGEIAAFPSPAYWKYRVLSQRIRGTSLQYRLGETFLEEVCACILGGYGIPAAVGVTAFLHLKGYGIFGGKAYTETEIAALLGLPLECGGKSVRYRFAAQKSKYIAKIISSLRTETPTFESGIALRNWLVCLPGIGLKTASWVARNWLDADDVAILDIHILRAGRICGFFKPEMTVQNDYFDLERQFLEFSQGLGVRASELDAVMWYEMMSAPKTIHAILKDETFQKNDGKFFTAPIPKAERRHPEGVLPYLG
jgi:N-glycosylase/DNA lyase